MAKKELSIAEKKEWAKTLYTIMGITLQKELAERTGVSAQTINKWVNSENWEVLRASVILTKEAELRRLYRRLTFLNDTIEAREKGENGKPGKPIDAKEADAIAKLGAAIRSLETETSISEAMSVLKDFIGYVQQQDFEQAKAITRRADEFIKGLIR